jgi:hypothetical protein
MMTEAALKTMVRSDIPNPPSRTVQAVRPLCMSNIAQQRRYIVAHPGQHFYTANGSRFNFSGLASAIP